MFEYKKVFTMLLIGLFIFSCKQYQNDVTEVNSDFTRSFDIIQMKKIIQEKNNQFTQAHVSGDNLAIDTLFTLDAKCLPPNAQPIIGRDSIAVLTADFIEYGVSDFHEETVELYGCEDMLIDRGNYSMTYGPDNTFENGKYLNVWKKVDGQWKIYSNMWNTNE